MQEDLRYLLLSRTYTVKAINVGSFDLGEADRVLTLFCPEKGILKAVAKGARKPGSKMAGRSDVLCVNELLLSPGRTFEIITQAQTIESFPALRNNLSSLSYGLYLAELTACFGTGLEDELEHYYESLLESLRLLSKPGSDCLSICIDFEMALLDLLGYKPELTFCIGCRDPLTDYTLGKFNIEFGGIVCSSCTQKNRRLAVRESTDPEIDLDHRELSQGVLITPLVWKMLVLATISGAGAMQPANTTVNFEQVRQAAQRILQAYIEQRAGKKFKSLDFLNQVQNSLRT